MWVRMIQNISGGRHDGKPWPAAGVPFEVENWEGEDLVLHGHALRSEAPPQPHQSASKADWVDYAVSQGSSPVKAAEMTKAELQEEPELREETAPGPPSPLPASLPPSPGAPRTAWAEYAVSQGMSASEAAGMTKVQLQSAFGGRMLP